MSAPQPSWSVLIQLWRPQRAQRNLTFNRLITAVLSNMPFVIVNSVTYKNETKSAVSSHQKYKVRVRRKKITGASFSQCDAMRSSFQDDGARRSAAYQCRGKEQLEGEYGRRGRPALHPRISGSRWRGHCSLLKWRLVRVSTSRSLIVSHRRRRCMRPLGWSSRQRD
jgi:hypothetical protein